MIVIETTPLREMKDHAARIYPDECCGFFYGSESEAGLRTLREIKEVHNAKQGDKKRRFEISAADYMKAERYALETNQQLLGIYHSHPDHPAIPSEHDRLAAQPYFSYIILSVLKGVVDNTRSWRLNDNAQFEKESIANFQFTKSI